MQLTYIVINMWRINVWVEGAFTCSYHTINMWGINVWWGH